MRNLLFAVFAIIMLAGGADAGIVSGSTGADGAFSATASVELQVPPDGRFNFTSVSVPSGVTVTFKRNSANTPVYILATGNVVIAGKISVDAAAGGVVSAGLGGPGGFDGGLGGTVSVPGGRGLGPGGGDGGVVWSGGGGAGYLGPGGASTTPSSTLGGVVYGNDGQVPLIGGSGGGGGGGGSSASGGGGGGGGGAILIAAGESIIVTGSITANAGMGGGTGYWSYSGGGGGGSGGAIRLIANSITGEGSITAIGGDAGKGGFNHNGGGGSAGRVRIEANSFTRTSQTNPVYTFGRPSSVFVPNLPSIKITSVGGTSVPVNPSGVYASPDVLLSGQPAQVEVVVSATGIPAGTQVTITAVPEWGAAASVTTTLGGTTETSTASANVAISSNYRSLIFASATFMLQTAMTHDGEKIEKAVVSGSHDGVVFITASGKMVPARELIK